MENVRWVRKQIQYLELGKTIRCPQKQENWKLYHQKVQNDIETERQLFLTKQMTTDARHKNENSDK